MESVRSHDKDMLIAGLEADLAKARAEVERLRSIVHADGQEMDRLRAIVADRENQAKLLRAALSDMDDLIEEYPIDIVGTGYMPPKKEQARVDAIVQASNERQRERHIARTHEQKLDGNP